MKRKRVIISVVFVLLLVGIGCAYVLLPKNKITAASWKQIQLGMTQSQVEDILGGPGVPLNEDIVEIVDRLKIIDFGELLQQKDGVGKTQLHWISRNGCIEVNFDDTGHVRCKYFQEWKCADSNFLDRVRDWLGW